MAEQHNRSQLRRTAYTGDPDTEELHSFFLPDHQFAGDTLWSFGTSLKAAYVNSFEFMNHAPVVQLWRDEGGAVQAVLRLSLGTGEWFHLARPAYRDALTTRVLLAQADAAIALLTDHDAWHTVRYESCTAEIELLEQSGYVRTDIIDEVYMAMALDQPIESVPLPAGIQLRLLDTTDAAELHERAMAQIDAFSDGEPTELAQRWIGRSLPHQLSYGDPHGVSDNPNIIAIDPDGGIVSFADVFFDRTNQIGEFEPVGTRKRAQRTGLAKSILIRGLQEMRAAGMSQAVVRTGHENHAAIAAYESVGFKVTDHLVRFRKSRT